MTLFSARSWWSSEGGDFCDKGCLCIANINNDPSTGNKIILGTFTGSLRIYAPHPPEQRNEDILLEAKLNAAIIQVTTGHFNASSPNSIQLVILHPKHLIVYSVAGDVQNSLTLTTLFEYPLRRAASSLVVGRFGGSAIDAICVLSMDGMLQFFNKEAFQFSRAIPAFLLPGPMAYIPETDSIVTASSSCSIDSYKYSVLTAASETQGDDNNQSQPTPQKRVKADWSLNVGEHINDLCIAPAPSDVIVALGERSVFWLNQAGLLKLCKRLVSPPRCITTYGSGEGQVRALLATTDQTVQVLSDSKIVWAAHVTDDPVCMAVSSIGGVDGIITSVDENGALSCWYLGTDPSMPVAATTRARDIDYNEADKELRAIQKKIRGTLTEEIPTEVTDVVKISSQVSRIKPSRDVNPSTVDATIEILHSGSGVLADTCLRITPPQGWAVNHSDFPLPELGEDYGDIAEVHATFQADCRAIPHGTVAEASLAYMNNTGQPRVVTAIIALPFAALCTGTAPTKSAIYKVTIAASCPQPSLIDLFGDISCPGFQPSAIGLRFYCGVDVSIVASKGRYRVQSDAFAIIYIVLCELERRLRGLHAGCEVTYAEDLPLPDLFILVDQHFQYRLQRAQAHSILDEQAKLFRGIQKRLLSKFKDNTPTQLEPVYVLLQTAHDKIMELADKEIEAASGVELAMNRLSAGLRLLVLLLRLQLNLDENQIRYLESTLCVDATDTLEQGWEECVLSALTYLVKMSLARGTPESVVNPQPLSLPEDPSRVRKAIATLCERIKSSKIVAQ